VIPAATTEMTVSVKVLVVDGSRRMSHKFFWQIPVATVIDTYSDDLLRPDFVPWGFVTLDNGPQIVGVLDGRLVRSGGSWNQEGFGSQDGEQIMGRVIEDLDQLYIGG